MVSPKNECVDKTIPKELLQHYRQICISILPPNVVTEIKQKEGSETEPEHLIWMLTEIQENLTMSSTKRHRWLGYIQGILVSKGVIDVKQEREYTRGMFNGN